MTFYHAWILIVNSNFDPVNGTEDNGQAALIAKIKNQRTCDKDVSQKKEVNTAGTAMDEKALSNVTYNSTPFLVLVEELSIKYLSS